MSTQTIPHAPGVSTPDIAAAKQFLNLLDPTAEFFTWQYFSDDKSSPTAGNFSCTLDDALERFEDLQSKGCGIFYMVNAGDGKGRSAVNVVRLRAIWVDWDAKPGEPTPPSVWPIEPSIVIESSPGKFHYLWLLRQDNDLSAAEHKAIEVYLRKFGNDKSANDACRVLRLPGLYHLKDPNNPFMTRIVSMADYKYTGDEIRRAFLPAAQEKPVHDLGLGDKPEHLRGAIGPDIGPAYAQITRDDVAAMLKHVPLDESYGGWLNIGMALHSWDEDAGLELWHDWSRQYGDKYNEQEINEKWRTFKATRGGVTIATIARIARDNGYTGTTPRAQAGKAAFERTDSGEPGDLVPRITKLVGPNPFGCDNHTDLANARRIKHAYGHALRYCPAIGWLIHRHTWRPNEHAGERVFHNLGCLIRDEATEMDKWVAAAASGVELKLREAARSGRIAWAMKSESSSKISDAIELGAREMAISADQLDCNPLHIGLANGIYDLGTGTFHVELPDAYVTHAGRVAYEPGATCPRWQAFVMEIMDGDAAMVAYLQRLMGYVLGADRSEHLLLIMHGGGANGKSTFVGIIQKLMGSYAMSLPGDVLSKSDGMTPSQRAELRGKRLCVLAETRDGGRLNESQVKELTGSDSVAGRALYKNDVTFIPSHQLLIQTNHRPVIRGDDHGIWRRIELIPFNVRFDDQTKDPKLGQKLEAELPGILNWMIEGYQQFKVHGLSRPDTIKKAKAAYRNEEDVFTAWFAECCDTSKSTVSTSLAILYCNFKNWAEEEGIRGVMTRKHFGQRLADAGYPLVRGGGRAVSVAGITILSRI
jgi:P4 family phage/plasmid primase-like protien